MKKEVSDYIAEKANELLEAPMTCQELKDRAHSWLNAFGTENEAEETKRFIAELEADIMPIDTLIQFAGSYSGKQYFGEEVSSGIVSHSKEIKASGAKYCDCQACSAVAAILSKKQEMLP